jgi:mannose-6-phosphate isomerase
MKMSDLYPLKFRPVYKDYPWGNTRLPKLYNREAPEGIYAESWEISAHADGMSIVDNGVLEGQPLASVVSSLGTALLGSNVPGEKFPLLIKLIDATQPLSVQVHPNNENEASVQGEAKTEMWYFLDGAEGAQVYCGLKAGITREDFIQALENKTFKDILLSVPAKKGEAVFVPGGRVHAIDTGCLILEIQQSSNTTYRVYDWGRVDAQGNGRELHIDKALKVIDFEETAKPRTTDEPFVENGIEGVQICKSPFFKLDRFELDVIAKMATDGSSFHAWFVGEGDAIFKWAGGEVDAPKGTALLIPAELGEYTVVPADAGATVLRTTVPN